MKPIYVMANAQIEYDVKCNGKGSKIEIGDHVRISK